MTSQKLTYTALVLAGVIQATTPPSYSGYTLQWDAPFTGNSGSLPDSSDWKVISGYLGVNAELEEYTSSVANVQLSGGETLQLVPWRDSSTLYGWTSGRIESVDSWTPDDGVITRVEAEIAFGTNAQSTKQGLWPAFWLLPEAFRTGAQAWPESGELDILETIDGVLTGYGTVHCGEECNDDDNDEGLQTSITIPDDGSHIWRLEWDRTSGNWEKETIEWSMDGDVFHTITGSSFSEAEWSNLAHQPYYIILDMAVGGSWPGDPSSGTLGGYGAMMEVFYVAIYST
ncbi:unnamed protein product [Discula destructiva]